MTIYAGIKITLECFGTGTNPWVATIDLGPNARSGGGIPSAAQQVITASTLAALCTAVQVPTVASGIT
jgi:hypothetical protein